MWLPFCYVNYRNKERRIEIERCKNKAVWKDAAHIIGRSKSAKGACQEVYHRGERESERCGAAAAAKAAAKAIAAIIEWIVAAVKALIAAIAAGGFAVLFTGDMEDENSSVSNWVDVLGVYSVYATTGDNAAEVITVTPENNEKLRKIFYDMNSYSVHTETETVEEVEVDDYGATLASVSSN